MHCEGHSEDRLNNERIRDLNALEQYLDNYLQSEGLTFEKWMERFGDGQYAVRNEVILRLLRPHRPRRIIEFACAGGYLARLILQNLPGVEHYVCSNYSLRVVDYCKGQLSSYRNCDVTLINADVMESDHIQNSGLEAYDTFITTSFEHIEHDLELIERFPRRSCFVFCVAGFDDPEHVRIFGSAEEIRARYGEVLSISEIVALGDEAKKYVTLAWTK